MLMPRMGILCKYFRLFSEGMLMLWRASAFMAIRHHVITSALYPIRDGASSGDRLIIGRADFFFRHLLLLTDKMLMPRVGILFQRFRLFSEGCLCP